MFALRHKETGKLMGVSSWGTEASFSTDVIFSLRIGYDNIWVVYDRKVAEKAAITDTEHYNACYDTPENDYVGQLEVIELVIK